MFYHVRIALSDKSVTAFFLKNDYVNLVCEYWRSILGSFTDCGV